MSTRLEPIDSSLGHVDSIVIQASKVSDGTAVAIEIRHQQA